MVSNHHVLGNRAGVTEKLRRAAFVVLLSVAAVVILLAQPAMAIVEVSNVSGEAYARANFVEIGQNAKGAFGASTPNLPAGYHSDATRSPGLFGFISNPQDNDWATFDGDFFTPGTKEEGFGLQLDGTPYHNNSNIGTAGIPGSISSTSTGLRGGAFTAFIDWSGSIGGVDVERTTTITENGAFILMETTLTNTTGADIDNIFWYHNVDPDNDQTLGGSYQTNNSILSQPSITDDRALVIATQNPGQFGSEPDGSTVSLYANDARARVTHGGFSNRDAAAIHGATGCDAATGNSLSGDVGCASASAQDKAISLAFSVGTLGAGMSTELVYAYNLDDDPTELETYYEVASQPDGDSDGLTDQQEANIYGTNPALPDTDGDGISDGEEVALGTNPLDTDTDGDGITDDDEVADGTDPSSALSYLDTDGDGVPDAVEILEGTSPTDVTDNLDDDGDGHPNYVEIAAGSDPALVTSLPADSDGDGLPDVVEMVADIDTDSDGHYDYVEMLAGSDETAIGDVPTDTDGDLVPDVAELMGGTSITDPLEYPEHDTDGVPSYVEAIDGTDESDGSDYADTDGGIVPDYVEEVALVNAGLDATDASAGGDDTTADTDGDGSPDAIEVMAGSDPTSGSSSPVDTDADGVPDVIEALDGTDPLDGTAFVDTDGDGFANYIEVLAGSDPADIGSIPADTDGDLVPDVIEGIDGVNSDNTLDYKDTDGDGVPDYVEATTGTDLNDDTSFIDTDSGTVPDYVELVLLPNSGGVATDETQAADDLALDTDGDGVPDAIELMDGTSPTDGADHDDTDGDGHPDYVEDESVEGDASDSALVPEDTDGDGVPDVVEVLAGTDPGDATSHLDTDGDGHPDYVEHIGGGDANDSEVTPLDSDGDDVPDVVEVLDGTDPTNPDDVADADNDGSPDYAEVLDGTDPAVEGDVDLDHDGALDSVDSDDDGDGIDDSLEDAGRNDGDANGDGIKDSRQKDVAAVSNKVTGAMTTLDTTSSSTVCGIQVFEILDESDLSVQNEDAEFPVGLNSFTIECANPGDTAEITVFYDEEYDTTDWVFNKFNSVTNVFSEIADVVAVTQTNVAGDTVTTATYSITDGSSMDEDGEVNGTIVDPAGPGVETQTLADTGSGAIPSVLVGLVLLAGAVSVTGLARKQSE